MSENPFFSCRLCKAEFKDPKILPCYHTFCLTCLKRCFDVKDKKMTKAISSRLECPVCGTKFRIGEGGLLGLKTNEYIRKFDDLDLFQKIRKDNVGDGYLVQSNDWPSVLGCYLKEVGHAIEMIGNKLEKAEKIYEGLKKCALRVLRKINHYEKDASQLFQEVEAAVQKEENNVDNSRTELTACLLGLHHHREKLRDCLQEGAMGDYIETVLSNCRSLLTSIDIMTLVEKRAMERIEFMTFNKESNRVGKLIFVKESFENHHFVMNPSRTLKITCTLELGKGIKTVAYSPERGEMYLIANNLKEILIFYESEMNPNLTMEESRGTGCEPRGSMVHFLWTGDSLRKQNLKHPRSIYIGQSVEANDAVYCSCYVFISERTQNWIHKIPVVDDPALSRDRWNINSYNNGLSVTSRDTILVSCNSLGCIHEYTIGGEMIRATSLSKDFTNPRHAIIIPSIQASGFTTNTDVDDTQDHFVVCLAGAKHIVVVIDSDGKVINSYPTLIRDKQDKLNYPVHLTFLGACTGGYPYLLCDRISRRLVLLNEDLNSAQNVNILLQDKQSHSRTIVIDGKGYTKTIYMGKGGKEMALIRYPSKTFVGKDNALYLVNEGKSGCNTLIRLEAF